MAKEPPASARRGREAEDAACAYLTRQGFKLLERNFRSPWARSTS